jgi:hypothetical protein
MDITKRINNLRIVNRAQITDLTYFAQTLGLIDEKMANNILEQMHDGKIGTLMSFHMLKGVIK